MGENRRVIVVGAGISGLAAARELVQRGYEVVVLEGRNRPGGRTVSVDMGGAMVDIGAAFIHGKRLDWRCVHVAVVQLR